MIANIKKPVFKEEHVVLSDEGELVHVKIGADTLTFHYEDALKISHMLRMHAKRAKQRAGDTSRHWSAIANLGYLEQGQ